MAGIIFTSPNSGKRIDQAITRRLNTSLGFRFYADSTTTPSIADIHPTGIITLPNLYVLGRYNLSVWVNGILRSNVGPSDTLNDYTELNNRQIRLSEPIRDVLAANETTSNIEIRWDRHWPGVRDANLSNLSNMTTDIEDAVLNADSPSAANPFLTGSTDVQGALSAAASPTALNPFATIGDAIALGTNFNILNGGAGVSIYNGGTSSGNFSIAPHLGGITTPQFCIVRGYATGTAGGSGQGNAYAQAQAYTPGAGGLPPAGAVPSADARQIAAFYCQQLVAAQEHAHDTGYGIVIPGPGPSFNIGWTVYTAGTWFFGVSAGLNLVAVVGN
jgi:hypothetical protein